MHARLGQECEIKRAGATLDRMSRTGIPMYAPAQHAYVNVTIDQPGAAVHIRRWKGRSCKSVKAAAKKAYPRAKLGFGRCWWVVD